MPALRSALPRRKLLRLNLWPCSCWLCGWDRHGAPSKRATHENWSGTAPHSRQTRAILSEDAIYEELAPHLFRARDFLFLGRGIHYPIALEGALKLKEISYIHAEGYPAGEMKHGPNALIDENLPVVVIATHDESEESKLRYEKTLSNIQEVKARGGIVVAIGE